MEATVESADSPRLLVSVRSPEEARIAAAAGADLIDIKEPRRGSLGFAGGEMIDAIGDAVGGWAGHHPPMSVALGELADWSSASVIPRLPANVAFAKIGLSGCREQADWLHRWILLRKRFDEAAARPLNWIAVHYVDRDADGPRLPEILAAADQSGCMGVLLDTFGKEEGGLFDHISEGALIDCRDATRRANLLLAVAGRLRLNDIPRLRPFAPDIIAVRGAVCHGGERGGRIDSGRVRQLQMSMRQDRVNVCLEGKYSL